jgi:beta-phosphoglucomutase family hydrolase
MIQFQVPVVAAGLAIIFDLDGVIVDSNPVHRQAWVRYNRRQGIETDEAMLEFMYGKRNDEIVRHYFGDHLEEEEIARHGAAKEALYREMMAGEVEARLVPGVREFIQANAGRPIALASNAEPANVEFLLEASGLRRYFRVVVDGHQVRNPKPHPEVFLRAADRLGVLPADTIVFEDSHSGVLAARAAGARVVGLRTTHRDLAGTALNVEDFRSLELAAWLRNQEPLKR